MKKLTVILILFIAFGCKEPESPRPVAEAFLTAMGERNFEEARKYSAPETMKLLRQLERIEQLSKIHEQPGKLHVRIISEDIKGNTAVVYFREEGFNSDQKITLRKVETHDAEGRKKQEWKVSLKKEEIPVPVWPNSPDSIPRIPS